MINIILKVVLITIGFIIFFSLLQFVVSIHPPKYTYPNTPDQYGLIHESISFTTNDGIEIKGWLIPAENANGTVIIGHGYPFNKGNILPVTKFLHPEYNLLYYDHRYFGESSGWITTVGVKEVEDVKAAVEFTKKRFPDKPIALYGFSLSASAMLMSNTNVNAIIADSPYANLELMVGQVFKYLGPLKWPLVKTTNLWASMLLGINPKKVSPAEAVKGSTIPIFLVHGEKDTQIPVENSYLIQESNPKIKLWIVEGSDHGQAFNLVEKEYQKKMKSFLEENMND